MAVPQETPVSLVLELTHLQWHGTAAGLGRPWCLLAPGPGQGVRL